MSDFAGLPPATASPSDAVLAAASRSGDAMAYATLSQRHAIAARNLARQLVPRRAEANDVVAAAFADVLDVLRRGDDLGSAFRPYLLTTVRRVAEDRPRPASTQVVTHQPESFAPGASVADPRVADPAVADPAVADPTVAGPDVAGPEQALIARAFASLPERWQAALWHTEIEGARPAEVAPLLGLTATGAAVLAYRAREGLRQAYLRLYLSDGPRDECRPVVAGLGVYARGGLATQAAAESTAHLDQCADCRDVLADLGDVKVSLRNTVAPLILGAATAGYLTAATRSSRSSKSARPVGSAGSAGSARPVGSAGLAGPAAGWATSRQLWLRHAPKGQQAAAAGVAVAAVAVVVAASLTAMTLTAHPGAVADGAPAHRSLPPTAATAPAAPPSFLDSTSGCGALPKRTCRVPHPPGWSTAQPRPSSQAPRTTAQAPRSQPTPGFSPSPPVSSSPKLAATVPGLPASASTARALTEPAPVASASTAPPLAPPVLAPPVLAAPASTAPASTAPVLAEPAPTASAFTVPASTAPVLTEPAPVASVSTAPALTLPASTAPATRAPATTAPATTTPATTAPETTAPATTTPATAVPSPAVSSSAHTPSPGAVRPAQLAARIDLVGALPQGATGIVSFTVTNSSPVAAMRLEANVTLPPSVSYLAAGVLGQATAASPGGWICAASAHGASCTHGPLAAGTSSTSYLPVAVAADAPAGRAPAISVGDGGRPVRARGPVGVTAVGFPAQFAASGRYAVVTVGSRLAGAPLAGSGGVPLTRVGRANLTLPGRVVWAGLYWAWAAGPPQAAIELRGPGGRYQRVAGTAAAMASLGVRGQPKVAARQAFADVTGLVARYGAGSWTAAVSPVAGSASRDAGAGARAGGPQRGSSQRGDSQRNDSHRGTARPSGATSSASRQGSAAVRYFGWTLVVVVADDTAPVSQVMVLGGVRQVDAADPHFSASLGGLAAGRAVRVKVVRWTADGPQASVFTHPSAGSPAVSFTAGAIPYLVGVITATDSRERIRP